jgi:hypothetical protein
MHVHGAGQHVVASCHAFPHATHPEHICCAAPLPICAVLQADINERMRAILIDWLVEVHLKFKVRTLVPPRAAQPPAPRSV